MDTSNPPQAWTARFDDSDSSSSGGSNNSTPTSSPRPTDAPAANQSQSIWEKEPEVTSSTRENNWANFDQFDSLQVQKENSKDDDLKTSTTDSAVEPKETKVETMVLSEEPDISPEKLVEMEIAAAEAFAAPSSPSDPSSSTPPTDVAMEVQEDAKSSDAEEKPNVSGNTASQVSPMETDDMPTSS
uniref:Uncharacterized protein n=1 Tax=Ciona savignyi TaxID=51511 RepID=H2ZK11_CIOSA